MGRFTEQGNGEKELIFQLSGMRSESEKEIVRVRKYDTAMFRSGGVLCQQKKRSGFFSLPYAKSFCGFTKKTLLLIYSFFCKLKRSVQQEGAELLKSQKQNTALTQVIFVFWRSAT